MSIKIRLLILMAFVVSSCSFSDELSQSTMFIFLENSATISLTNKTTDSTVVIYGSLITDNRVEEKILECQINDIIEIQFIIDNDGVTEVEATFQFLDRTCTTNTNPYSIDFQIPEDISSGIYPVRCISHYKKENTIYQGSQEAKVHINDI